MKYDFETERIKIRKHLIEQGYANKLIDYKKFLELYDPYKDEMSEIQFAEILEIEYSYFMKIKNTARNKSKNIETISKKNNR